MGNSRERMRTLMLAGRKRDMRELTLSQARSLAPHMRCSSQDRRRPAHGSSPGWPRSPHMRRRRRVADSSEKQSAHCQPASAAVRHATHTHTHAQPRQDNRYKRDMGTGAGKSTEQKRRGS